MKSVLLSFAQNARFIHLTHLVTSGERRMHIDEMIAINCKSISTQVNNYLSSICHTYPFALVNSQENMQATWSTQIYRSINEATPIKWRVFVVVVAFYLALCVASRFRHVCWCFIVYFLEWCAENQSIVQRNWSIYGTLRKYHTITTNERAWYDFLFSVVFFTFRHIYSVVMWLFIHLFESNERNNNHYWKLYKCKHTTRASRFLPNTHCSIKKKPIKQLHRRAATPYHQIITFLKFSSVKMHSLSRETICNFSPEFRLQLTLAYVGQ